MTDLKCSGCGKKLLTYDNYGFKRYKSPLKKCKKCGKMYIDPRCHEIAIEGMPSDEFSVTSYLFLIIFGGLIVWRGVYLFKRIQIGVPDEMQWFMPAVFIIMGAVCVIGGIGEIIFIKTGGKTRKFERLRIESEERLRDNSYAELLRDLGYKF